MTVMEGCFAYARIVLAALVIGGCSSASDQTAPPDKVDLQLSVDQDHVTNPGNLTFEVRVSGSGVQRVDLYQRGVGADSAFQVLASDNEAPFEFLRPITSPDSNGTFEYTARAFNGTNEVAVSNPLTVIIDIPDPRPLVPFFIPPQPRITTPGSIKFGVEANKVVTRLEVYSGDTKVASLDAPTSPYTISVPITAADNGAKAFVVKAYDAYGNVVASDPMSVLVDIRWSFIRNVDFNTVIESEIATDGANSVYIAGTSKTLNADGSINTQDGFIEKYDGGGNPVWSRVYGGADWETVKSLAVDGSGNVLIAGSVLQFSAGRPADCFVAIFSSEGAFVRSQGVTDPTVEHVVTCQATWDASGNLYILGASFPATTDGQNFIAHFDRDGHEIWLRKFKSVAFPSTQVSDIATGIVADASGVYIGGYTGGSFDGQPNRGRTDAFLLKFDPDGNKLWAAQYGTVGLEISSKHLTLNPAGGVYLAGHIDWPSDAFHTSKALIVSYAADGTQRWVQTLDSGGSGDASQVAVSSRGVFLVGSFGGSVNPGMEPLQNGRNAFLAQFTPGGDLVATRLLSGGTGTVSDGAVAANGDIYVDAKIPFDPTHLIYTPLLARHHDPGP